MSLTRRYETKEECTHLMVNDMFSCFYGPLITDDYSYEDWSEHWSFKSIHEDWDQYYDEEELEAAREYNELFMVGMPMWSTWFEIVDSWLYDKIADHEFEVSELGFTLIYHDDELWGLGVDGAGYDFYEAHWIPLYDWLGLKWHE